MPDEVPRFDDWVKTRAPREPDRRGLDPQFQTQVDDLLKSLQRRGLNARLSEGYRSPQKQDEYFAQGRTKPGRIITNATGTTGKHPRGIAADIDLLDASGRPLADNDPSWQAIGEEAAGRGLTWGGKWKLRDMRHVELNQRPKRQSASQVPTFDQWQQGDADAGFRRWYERHAKRLKLNPDPDAPEHHYDYRSAYQAGASPDAKGHWPSRFKRSDHPNRYVDGEDTITGRQIPKFDDWAKDSEQTLPPKRETKSITSRRFPVTPAQAQSAPKLFDRTIPNPLSVLTQDTGPRTFAEDRAVRTARQKTEQDLTGRVRQRMSEEANFTGEEYQNFLRLNRTLDNPRQREALITLKTKQAVASAKGSPYAALLESDRQRRVAKMSMGQRAAQVPKSLAVGIGEGVGGTIKSTAIAGRKIVDQLTNTRGFDTQDTIPYRIGDYIQKRVPEIVRSNPDLEQEFFVGKAPSAVGQSLLFLLGGAVSKSPKLAVSLLGAGMTAGDAYDEVRALGGSDDEAVNAGLIAGTVLGPTELLGTRGLLKAIAGTPAEATLKAALKTALREGRRDVVENALQEIGQEYVQGRITGRRRSFNELLEAAALGAFVGAGTAPVTLATQVGGRRAENRSADNRVVPGEPEAMVVPGSSENVGETQPRLPADQGVTEPAAAPESPTESDIGQPQRFYHKDWGEVEVLEDQSGARPGRVKVAEVADPTKQHFPKRSDLSGRGNQRMVPVKSEPDLEPRVNLESGLIESQGQPAETPPLSQTPEALPAEGARLPSTPPTPEIIEKQTVTPRLEAPVLPALSERQTKNKGLRLNKAETTAAGFKTDLTLSQFVRKMGGIVPTDDVRGELDRLRLRDSGTTGLINRKAKQGNVRQSADIMMQAANDAGYRDPNTGQPFENPGNFLYAVERDVAGDKIRVRTGDEIDFETEYRNHVMKSETDKVSNESADALISLLENEEAGTLYERISSGTATAREVEEFRSTAKNYGVSDSDTETLIRAGAENSPAEADRLQSTPEREAEQLGFVEEGLTQQTVPPKSTSQRDALIQAEQQRQAELNPERTAALARLDEIKRRGMTVDDYARQPDLMGNVPSAEEIRLLKELESTPAESSEESGQLNFGPGTMRAGEPLPEVKERKFGKRFTEDERIAEEIRSEIGTAKYYEPIPNKITAAQAKELVDQRGIGESIRIIRDEKNDLPAHIRSVMGQIVIQRLNQTYRNLKQAGSDKADDVLEQAVDLAEWAMDYGTRLGQGVQSFAMWSRLTPEGHLLRYKRAVKTARERHQKLYSEDVAEIVNVVNKEGMTDAERVEALKNLFKTNKTAKKIKTDFDKLIEAAKTGKLTDTLFYEIVGDRLGLPKYDQEVARKITELALRIEEAPEGLPRNKILQELHDFLAAQKGFDVADLPLGIFYGNILSGYNTHAVNFSDTGLNVLSEINGLALNNPRAAAKIYAGMLRGFSEGRWDAMLELTRGRMVTDGKWLEVPRLMEIAKFGQRGGVPIKTETKAGQVAKKIAESKIAIPLNAYKYVTRAMAASDAVMFRAAKEARATLLAYRIAKAEGLTDAKLEQRVREILALDREADFMAQANREGFTGKEAQFRAKELREMVRDKDLSADAAEFAGEATYNHTPHGTLGLISERIGKLAEDVKPLKLFVPFTRIVANVTNRGLNYTPYGYKRAFAGWGFGANTEPLTAEGRRLMLTRATLGTAGMVLLGVMQQAGLLAIHGNGPSDREKRRQLQNAGWRPYSLQIGDVYISYVYSPVGLGLSIIGNMKDAERYHELQQKDAATRAAYSVARLGSTIFSQSFLSGLSRLFNALSDRPEVSVTAVKQTLGGTAAAFAVPNIFRDVHRLFDNKAYQSNTLMEDLIRNTPFAALALNPQLNAFGEPVELQRQRFVDVQTSDPAWRFVIQKGLRVPVPGRTTEIEKGKRITPEQYYKLLKTTGPQIKQWVLDNQQLLEPMTETEAQDELSEAATAIRKRALDEMRGKMVKPMKPPAPPKPEAPERP